MQMPENALYTAVSSKNGILHQNKFDRTQTEYYLATDRGVLDVFFDKALFQPPKSVILLDQKLQCQDKKA